MPLRPILLPFTGNERSGVFPGSSVPSLSIDPGRVPSALLQMLQIEDTPGFPTARACTLRSSAQSSSAV